MKISSLDELGKIKVTPAFSIRVFTIEQNGHTPFHAHAFEHLNYVIEGEGVLVTEGGIEREIEEGHFALVLLNEKHQYKNTGAKPLILICAVPKDYE